MNGLLLIKKPYYKYMRKILALIFSLFILNNGICFADGDLWDNFGDQNNYGKQQFVSDDEFDKALESKKRKKNKKIKGEEFHQANETKAITDTSEELPILCVPANLLISEDIIVPSGHYQVIGEKKNGVPVLKLYQAHFLMAEIPATETNDDFGQESVNFVSVIDASGNKLKIIFGSIDFNAFAVVDIAE